MRTLYRHPAIRGDDLHITVIGVAGIGCKGWQVTDDGGNREPEIFDQQGHMLTPTPRPKIDLRDAHAIRRELAAVYRDARSGRVEIGDATRLAYILDLLRRACETSELQARLELLERTIVHRRT